MRSVWLACIILFCGLYPAVSAALSTDEILRLKRAGIPEEVIVEMVESGYQDADKVLRLKESGFADDTIRAIVRGEAKNNQGKERISFETSGRATILWYLVQRGKPVLQNSRTVDNARICILDDSGLKLEWKEEKAGLLDAFRSKGFPPPFTWVLNKSDILMPDKQGSSFRLRSGLDHKGKPDSDGYHYWELALEPRDAQLFEKINRVLESR